MALKDKLLAIFISIILCNFSYGGTYGGGSGTEADPFLLETAAHLNDIGLNSGDWDKCFKLVKNINMSSIAATNYNIIGYYNNVNDNIGFSGIFDGNDHVIFNFSCSSSRSSHVGLFGYIESYDAEIKNLILVDPNVSANNPNSENIGALAGVLRHGKIINCQIDGGFVNGYSTVGGLVGENSSGEVITSCVFASQVNGHTAIGGLIGDNSVALVSNCYTISNVSAYLYAGGLIGQSDDGTVENCYAAGDVSGTHFPGGLIAVDGGVPSQINNCFWDSETTHQSSSAGGTSKTTAQMKTQSTFTDMGWDFVDETANGTNDIWMMSQETSYPVLSYLNNIDYNPVVPELNVLQISKTTVGENEPFTVTVSGNNVGVTEPTTGGIAIQVKQVDYENRKMDISDYRAEGSLNNQYIWWKGDTFPAGQKADNLHIEPTWDDWSEERTLQVTLMGRQAGTYDIYAKMYLEAYNGNVYRDPAGLDLNDHHNEATVKIGTVTVLASLPRSLYEVNAHKLHRQDVMGENVRIGIIESLGYPWENHLCFSHLTVKNNFDKAPASLHATQVASILCGLHYSPTFIPTQEESYYYSGIAPHVSAKAEHAQDSSVFHEKLDSLISFGADVINISISFGDTEDADDRDLMNEMDAKIDSNDITIVIGAGNKFGGSPHSTPSILARSYNCIAVGILSNDETVNEGKWKQISANNVFGPVENGTYSYGLCKPDIVAPGRCFAATNASPDYFSIKTDEDASAFSSFSAPHVAGAVTLMIDAARQNNSSLLINNKLDPKIVKSVLLTGANKEVKGWRTYGDTASEPRSWMNGPTQPLDYELGAGGLDVYESARVLLETESDFFKAYTSVHTLPKQMGESFNLDEIQAEGMHLAATIVWNKHQGDLANLNLELLDRDDNNNILESSISSIDNVEHIYYEFLPPGNYSLKVMYEDGTGPATEEYALSYRVFHSGFAVTRKHDEDNITFLYISELSEEKLAEINATQALVGKAVEILSYDPVSQDNFATIRIFYDIDKFPEIDEKTIKINFWNPLLVRWDIAGDFSNINKNSLAKFNYGSPTDNYGDWGIDLDDGYAWANIDALGTYTLIGSTEPICQEDPDIDGSGLVDLSDFAMLAAKWLKNDCDCYGTCCDGADLNNDETVDIDDLEIFTNNWLFSSLTEGLIAYYPFDGDNIDIAGGHGGSWNGGNFITTGVKGQAYGFSNGTYFTAGTIPEIDNVDQLTVAIWFKGRNTDWFGGETIVCKGHYTGAPAFQLWFSGEDNPQRYFIQINAIGAEYNSTELYYVDDLSQWNHYALVYDGNKAKAYVNGFLINEINADIGYINTTGHSLYINRHTWLSSGSSSRLEGQVDEFRIYNRALSDLEIQRLYNLE